MFKCDVIMKGGGGGGGGGGGCRESQCILSVNTRRCFWLMQTEEAVEFISRAHLKTTVLDQSAVHKRSFNNVQYGLKKQNSKDKKENDSSQMPIKKKK